ncbi:MAG: phosphodiester glycosidase family protein [Ferruginibacter sp.]
MNKKALLLHILVIPVLAISFMSYGDNDTFISCTIDPAVTTLRFYWKDDKGNQLKSLLNLKNHLRAKGEKLLFAMNGGMYQQDGTPLGLFIQNRKTITPLNKRSGNGNFYLEPNGVFYIRNNNTAQVCTTAKFVHDSTIAYATQSGPMLVINGCINPSFKKGSTNLNTRNGVGILPGNKILFAMSKKEVSLYDFASFFKKAGCSNALYLDGFVSRTYLPEKKWIQQDGNFAVLIGASAKE